jgi:hypothetical protein
VRPREPRNRDDHNAAEAATVRRRHRRRLILMVVFAALMPVGCLVPGALAFLLPDGAMTALCVTALVLPLVGLGGCMLMIGDWFKSRRSLALLEQAERLGLRYTERPAGGEVAWLARLRSYRFTDGGGQGANLLRGAVDDEELWAVDYTCWSDDHRSVYYQTVFVLRGAVPDGPDFLVTPRGWLDKLGRIFGDKSIELPRHEGFSRDHRIDGDDAEAVRDCLRKAVVRLLERSPELTVEVHSGDLIAQRYGHRPKPDDYPRAIAQLRELAAALRGE